MEIDTAYLDDTVRVAYRNMKDLSDVIQDLLVRRLALTMNNSTVKELYAMRVELEKWHVSPICNINHGLELIERLHTMGYANLPTVSFHDRAVVRDKIMDTSDFALMALKDLV